MLDERHANRRNLESTVIRYGERNVLIEAFMIANGGPERGICGKTTQITV